MRNSTTLRPNVYSTKLQKIKMITYNFDKDFALPLIFPEEAEVVALQAPSGKVLWRYASELLEHEGLKLLDVPAQALGQAAGRLHAMWQPAPAGGGRAWDSRNRWLGWTPTTAVLSRGHELQVRLDRQSNGRYRADMQYATRDNGRTMTLSPDCAVVAMRCHLPKDAVVTWDVVTADGSTANTKDYASQISMADGTTLLLCNLTDAAAAGAMPVFQIKIADIPAASVSSMTTPSYDVWWIRAFASEADAQTFMNVEHTQPAEFAQHSRVYIGRGHRRRGADAADRINELKDARDSALQERDAALQQAEDTASELEAVRAELAAVDPAAEVAAAVERGLGVPDLMAANMGHDTSNGGYYYYGWGQQIEQRAGITKPWIMPSFKLPDLKPGQPVQLVCSFVMAKNLVYCGEIEVGEEFWNLYQCFNSCSGLIRAPRIDTSRVRNMQGCFYGCNLKDWPEWDYNAVENFAAFFQGNPSVEETSAIHLPKATSIYFLLWGCPKLRRIGPIYAPNATELLVASGYSTLERVDEIDCGCTTQDPLGGNDYFTKLRYCRLINLGKSARTEYKLSLKVWGDGSEENRRSLIDSLITCSYDRAAADMPVATIKMPSETIARLTDEEVAEITAKGFTIVKLTL